MKTNKLLKIRPLLFALTVLVFLMSAISAVAQTQLYVAPPPLGSSSNNGTSASTPKATIAQAHALIPSGGAHYTVNVASGTYVGAINTTKAGASNTQRVTYKSTTRGGAKIVLASSNTASEAVWDNNAANVTIDGFEVDGTYTSGTRVKRGIYMRLSNSTVQNCIVHDIFTGANGNSAGGAGIAGESYYGATNIHVLNNKVYRVGPQGSFTGKWYYHTIYHQTTGSIKNNVVYLSSGAGIHMWHNVRDIDVINNTIFNNDVGIVWGGGDYYTGWTGPARNIRMQNNIVAYSTRYGFLENGQNSTTSPNTISYNIVYQNGTNFQLVVTPQSNNIVDNPDFVNYQANGSGDYHLLNGSPAINAGLSTYAPANDYDLVTRTGNPDIGAYEYVASCGQSAVPATPSAPTATANSSSQITVTWTDNATNESNYLVERSTNPTTGFAVVATLGANVTSFVNNTGLSASTTYYYKVRASNCFGNSAYTATVNATTPAACGAPSVPNPPLNTAATANSSSQITVTWTDNSGLEENWLVERSTNATTGFVVVATLAPNTVTFVNNTGLSAGTTYYYKVRAVNCFGYSTYSATVNATTTPACGAPSVPNAPSSPSATAISSSQINLGWTDESGIEEFYEIERSLSSGSGFANIATLGPVAGFGSPTTYNNTSGLSASTTYYYRIRATNCFGNGAYSTVVSATTPAACGESAVPATATSLVATSTSSTQINLTWTDNATTETVYYVERATASGGPYTVLPVLKASTGNYASTDLSASTTYYYRVRSWNCFGYSAYTSIVNATTAASCGAPSVPNAPTALGLTVISSSQINLAWTDNSGIETSYKVERATASGGPFVEIASSFVNAVTFASTGLASSTTYWYRVRAYNCFGYSPYSNVPSATTASGFMSAPSSSATTASTEVSESVSSQISVYPNPSVTNFTLTIPSDVVLKGAMMKIYDKNGMEVKSVSINSNVTTIGRGSLQSGIYYYHIINNSQRIHNGKLMISNE